MKKAVNAINTILFHIHFAYLIVMIFVMLGIYQLPHQYTFQEVYLFIAISVATLVQLLLNLAFFLIALARKIENVSFKKHNYVALALWGVSLVLVI